MAAALPMAAVAAGGATQYIAQSKAQKEKQRRLNEALGVDASMSGQQRDLLTNQATNVYTPQTRDAALTDTQGKIATDLSSYLQKNNAPPSSTPSVGGQPSQEFVKASADNALNEGKRTAMLTSLYSKLMAPGQLRFNEGVSNANNYSNVDTISANRQNQQRARAYGINAVRPNSVAMLLGQLLMMGGGGGGGGGGGAQVTPQQAGNAGYYW